MLDRWLAAARAFLRLEGAGLVRLITGTTRELVREVVRDGLTEGLSPAEIARELREAAPAILPRRAERIARTETLRASNVGQMAAAREGERAGLVLDKVWLSTPDGRTRDTHRRAEGQRRALDEPFEVGGYLAQYPLDPALPAHESVLCRCTLLFEPRRDARGRLVRLGGTFTRAAPDRSERHAARNAHIRAEYKRRVKEGKEYRDAVLSDLTHGEVDGDAYYLSARQVRRIVDGT